VPYILGVAKCILVGTVSNVSKRIERDLASVLGALKNFSELSIFLVESDSSDNTLQVLERLKTIHSNFEYVSLDKLKDRFPDRIERIRFCRNEYVRHIRSLSDFDIPQFVVVADLDGMNRGLKLSSIESCFSNVNWDAVFPNQVGGYYDVLALRHQIWQPTDYNKELAWFRDLVVPSRPHWPRFYESFRLRIAFDRAREQAIYRKMIRIKRTSKWIEIDSGFGGIAIYKSAIFLKYDYTMNHNSESGESEHISLHSKMRSDGLRLFINPNFINSNWNTYNLNRYFLVRQSRQIIWNSPLLYRFSKLIRGNQIK
jgi:hypothetical protein